MEYAAAKIAYNGLFERIEADRMASSTWYRLPRPQDWERLRILRSILSLTAYWLVLGLPSSGVQSDETVPAKSDQLLPAAVSEDLNSRLRATPEELNLWIEQLASTQFEVREQASFHLSRCDASAIEILRSAAQVTPDLEVRSRCNTIADSIYDSDIGKRIKAFLKDSNPEKTYGFDGWIPFSRLAGEGRIAKRLFAELVETHPDIAQNRFDDASELAPEKAALEIWTQLRTGANIELADTVSLLYRAIRLEGNIPNDAERITLMLMRSAPFTIEIRRAPYRSVLQKLSGQWIQTTKSDPITVLLCAIDHDIPEGVLIARKELSDPNCDPNTFPLAIAALLRFGNKDDLPLLDHWLVQERLLLPPFGVEVATPVPIPQQPFNSELPDAIPQPPTFGQIYKEKQIFELRYQDLALAAKAKLLGRDDIRRLFPRLRTHPLRVFLVETLAFPQGDQKERQRVIDALKL